MTDAFLEILILAAVAGFVFMRLKGVLGTRVGRENPEEWGFGAKTRARRCREIRARPSLQAPIEES